MNQADYDTLGEEVNKMQETLAGLNRRSDKEETQAMIDAKNDRRLDAEIGISNNNREIRRLEEAVATAQAALGVQQERFDTIRFAWEATLLAEKEERRG